jgi:hypothetical protein
MPRITAPVHHSPRGPAAPGHGSSHPSDDSLRVRLSTVLHSRTYRGVLLWHVNSLHESNVTKSGICSPKQCEDAPGGCRSG